MDEVIVSSIELIFNKFQQQKPDIFRKQMFRFCCRGAVGPLSMALPPRAVADLIQQWCD